jgi:hypothetical protein
MRDNHMTEQHGENPAEPVGESSSQPEGSATPPPAPPPAAPSSAAGQYDFSQAKSSVQDAHKFDLGIIVAGVVAWLAGFMPFYTASVSAGGFSASTSGSAYHGFFGWFAVWVALAGALVVAAALFGVSLPVAVHQAAAALFGLSLVCLILALFIFPGGDCSSANGLGGISCDTGHGFGYWLAVLAVLAGLGLAVMRVRESTTPSTTA